MWLVLISTYLVLSLTCAILLSFACMRSAQISQIREYSFISSLGGD